MGENVRVFLRSLETGLLFKEGKEWTASHDEARDFRSVTGAVEFATKEKLKRVEAFLVAGSMKAGIWLPDPDSP